MFYNMSDLDSGKEDSNNLWIYWWMEMDISMVFTCFFKWKGLQTFDTQRIITPTIPQIVINYHYHASPYISMQACKHARSRQHF